VSHVGISLSASRSRAPSPKGYEGKEGPLARVENTWIFSGTPPTLAEFIRWKALGVGRELIKLHELPGGLNPA
jgi:hypothetical protein